MASILRMFATPADVDAAVRAARGETGCARHSSGALPVDAASFCVDVQSHVAGALSSHGLPPAACALDASRAATERLRARLLVELPEALTAECPEPGTPRGRAYATGVLEFMEAESALLEAAYEAVRTAAARSASWRSHTALQDAMHELAVTALECLPEAAGAAAAAADALAAGDVAAAAAALAAPQDAPRSWVTLSELAARVAEAAATEATRSTGNGDRAGQVPRAMRGSW